MVCVYTGCGCELSNSDFFRDIMSNSFHWSDGGEVSTCNQALHGCWVLQLSGVILMFQLVNPKHGENCCIYLHKSNSSDVYFGHFCPVDVLDKIFSCGGNSRLAGDLNSLFLCRFILKALAIFPPGG